MDPANLVKNRQQASYLGELTREEAWCTLALGGPRSIQAASVTAFPLLSSPTITVDGFRLSSLPLTLQPLCLSALSLDQFPEWGQLGSSLSLHQFLSPGREWSGFSISLSHQFPTHPTLSNLVLLQKSQHHLVLVLNPSQRSPHGLVLNPVQSPKVRGSGCQHLSLSRWVLFGPCPQCALRCEFLLLPSSPPTKWPSLPCCLHRLPLKRDLQNCSFFVFDLD